MDGDTGRIRTELGGRVYRSDGHRRRYRSDTDGDTGLTRMVGRTDLDGRTVVGRTTIPVGHGRSDGSGRTDG